jgi:chromosomal replication initiation ATPase DnaA
MAAAFAFFASYDRTEFRHMIQRIYIENFRCFERLDINFSNRSSILVIGKNGAGKSTLLAVFRLLQSIGLGVNRVVELTKAADLQSESPMRLEIDVFLDEKLFTYKLHINQGFLFPLVIDESLAVDGKEKLRNDYFPVLERNHLSQVLILIDCDHEPERIVNALDGVPQHLKDRVFMLGALGEPETLKAAMKTTFEGLGVQIANECFEEEPNVWKHPELAHNRDEVARLKKSLFEAVFQV